MPDETQTQGCLEEIAILTRTVGARRVILEDIEDDAAFVALCNMGGTVRTDLETSQDVSSGFESAQLRVHRVAIEVRRPVEQIPPEPTAKAA